MKTAMILAAGRGERLRPLSDHKPKPLFSICNQPLLARHLAHLAQAGFQRVVINHAYLGGQIKQFIKAYPTQDLEMICSPEPPGGLETGGGIVQALPLLGNQPFITLNGDVYTDYPLDQLRLPEHQLAHVILVDQPSYRAGGDYGLSDDGLLNNIDKKYIFSGITVYHPHFFKGAKIGRYSVTPMMQQWVNARRVSGERYSGPWFDIGSFDQWSLIQKGVLPD